MAVRHALRTEISPAIGVNGLSVDVARARAAQEAHGRGDYAQRVRYRLVPLIR